jgi:predicted transporter
MCSNQWMYGILVGAVFGMAFIAFMGAWRSLRNWQTSRRRPGKVLLGVQVGLQALMGLVCLLVGLYFLLAGSFELTV